MSYTRLVSWFAGSPHAQLDRFAFFAELRSVLPKEVDAEWGTGLSEALRTAASYLRDAPPENDRWTSLFERAGAEAQVVFDQAATKLLSVTELRQALERISEAD